MKSLFRKLHRWLGLLMAIQIVAWMASGLYFSIYPIEEIRGEHLTRDAEPVDKTDFAALGTTAAVIGALDTHFAEPWSLGSIGPVKNGDEGYWRVRGRVGESGFTRLINANGEVLPALTEVQAGEVAIGWLQTEGRIKAIDWVETAARGSEFRGGPLPVWRVSFDEPEALRMYLDPWTGDVLARRTTRWRVFDFLWMLHVMDFDDRDNFNHPLLQVSAALGLLVALGGVILWALTTRFFRKRRTARPSDA